MARQNDDWAKQVPERWRKGPYEDYGWEADQSSLPEFRDPSVHLTPQERERVERLARNNWIDRQSRFNPEIEDEWQGDDAGQGHMIWAGRERYDYGRDFDPPRQSNYNRQGYGNRFRQERYRQGGGRQEGGRPEGDVRDWWEQQRDTFRYRGRPRYEFGRGGLYGEPYGSEYSPQGYYVDAEGRGFNDEGNFSVTGNWNQGYSRDQSGPYTGMGPSNYHRSDQRIFEDVCDRLSQHGQLDASQIQVEVHEGEVTLSGTTHDRRQKRIAEDAIEDIPGVVDVHNRLHLSGMPGDGQGRTDEVGRTGVYPASGPLPPGNAKAQGMASWGQGERGAEGYQDHGTSEIHTEDNV